MSGIDNPKYRETIAELEELRDNIAARARDAARYEIGRLLRVLHIRFPRHKFRLDAGMGSVAVWCDKEIFGSDYCTPFQDETQYWHVHRRGAVGTKNEPFNFLEMTIRTIIDIAQDVENDFNTCVDTVGDE